MCNFIILQTFTVWSTCLSVCLSDCLLGGNLTSQVFMYYYLLLDTKTAEKNTSNTKMVMQKI